MNTPPIIRYTKPSRYETAAYNAICIVKTDQVERFPSMYVQTSEDLEYGAEWIDIGEILKGAMIDLVTDDIQRDLWVKQYKYNSGILSLNSSEEIYNK
jgi:hypothetical protein